MYFLRTTNRLKKSAILIKCRERPNRCHLAMKRTGKSLTSKAYSDVTKEHKNIG